MQLEDWTVLTLAQGVSVFRRDFVRSPGEGTPFGHAGTNHQRVRLSEALESFSLSPGERDGVRGKEAAEYPCGCKI
jgi:hypothetical protein